jgi:hypothetical protein
MFATMEYYAGKGNQEADWAWFLASKGDSAYSVGFFSHGGEEKIVKEDAEYTILKDNELLEISQVMIPANQDAVVGGKTFVKTMKEFVETIEEDIEDELDEEDKTILAKALKEHEYSITYEDIMEKLDNIEKIISKQNEKLKKAIEILKSEDTNNIPIGNIETEELEYDNGTIKHYADIIRYWENINKDNKETK